MLRTDIGEGDNALQCTTDSTTCCSNAGGEMRAGFFYFPVTDVYVPPLGLAVNGYYRDRLSQLIRLHRQPSGTITGQFRCNIPRASGSAADLFINIGEYKLVFSIVHSVYIPILQLTYLSPSLLLIITLLVMPTV